MRDYIKNLFTYCRNVFKDCNKNLLDEENWQIRLGELIFLEILANFKYIQEVLKCTPF